MVWVVSATTQPLYSRKYSGTLGIGGWLGPRLCWTGTEILTLTGIRSPERPARSVSLYRTRNTNQQLLNVQTYNFACSVRSWTHLVNKRSHIRLIIYKNMHKTSYQSSVEKVPNTTFYNKQQNGYMLPLLLLSSGQSLMSLDGQPSALKPHTTKPQITISTDAADSLHEQTFHPRKPDLLGRTIPDQIPWRSEVKLRSLTVKQHPLTLNIPSVVPPGPQTVIFCDLVVTITTDVLLIF
jgi:hypothetical protein